MRALLSRHGIIALAVATAVLTALRVWYCGVPELSPDEAYYWTWSADPCGLRVDHPPLLAWLIAATTRLLGETSIAVRLPAVLLAAASVPVVHAIARTMGLSRGASLASAALSTLLPSTATGAIIVTPDSPAALCWLLAILALARISRGARPADWYLLGAACGVGLLSKHSMAMIVLPMAAAMIPSPGLRSRLGGVHPWIALAIAALIASPVALREVSAGLPSVSFQLDHLLGALPAAHRSSIPERLLGLVGGQVGLLTPLVAFYAAVAAARARRAGTVHLVVAAGLLTPMLATLVAALLTHPEQNWASLGHPLAPVLAFHVLLGDGAAPQNRVVPIALTAATALAMTLAIHAHAARPFLPLPPDRDPVSRLHGWGGIAAAIPVTGHGLPVACDNYGLAAQLRWATRAAGPKVPIFSTDRPWTAPAGDWVLLDEAGDWGAASVEARCESRAPVGTLVLRRGDGAPVRTVFVASGLGCEASPRPH